jgi:hypothetical protein
MSVMAYFVPQARLPFKKVDESEEEISEYLVEVKDYDPVLRSHCRLDKEG